MHGLAGAEFVVSATGARVGLPKRELPCYLYGMKFRTLINSVCGFLMFGLSSCASESSLTAALALGLMGEDGGDKLFYYPTKDQPSTPEQQGYAFEDVYFKSSDSVRLHGWWIPAAQPKATIVYSHGNAGSVAYHVSFVYWLVDAGYNVLLYDYRGYGQSEGEITKAGAVRDAQAAFSYIAQRDDVEAIIAFGHSMGGAKTIAALAENAPDQLKAVIVDSTFASYQDVAARVAGEKARKVVSDTFEPYRYVQELPRVPLLVVHGTEDETIPFSQARKLFAAANQPKALMTIEGGNHVDSFVVEAHRHQHDLLLWMEKAIK